MIFLRPAHSRGILKITGKVSTPPYIFVLNIRQGILTEKMLGHQT